MKSAAAFIDDLASRGRFHFARAEAARSMAASPTAVGAALRRLKGKGLLAEPARGFFVIVPPEYRRLGCLPAEQFVPQLMAQWHEPYYVALLSAAELYGAAHQRPHVYQVMLRRNRRPIAHGAIRVEFAARRDMEATPTTQRNPPRGIVRVSAPEATAFELVGYQERCGGLDNVATVLKELAERMTGSGLKTEARRAPVAWVQRLGYLLELVGSANLARPLHAFVERAADEAPLLRSKARSGAPRDRRWKLALNDRVEPDL